MSYFELVTDTLQYIEENLRYNPTPRTIADHAWISQYHFHRIFRAVTGKSIKQYINLRRLSEAARYLLNENASVLETALEFSFNSPEAFTRAFKKNFGIPPAQFKRNPYAASLLDTVVPVERDFKNLGSKITANFHVLHLKELVIVGRKAWLDLSDPEQGEKIRLEVSSFVNDSRQNPSVHNDRLIAVTLEALKDAEKVLILYGFFLKPGEDIPGGMSLFKINPCKYAVCAYKGEMTDIHPTVLGDIHQWLAAAKMQPRKIGFNFFCIFGPRYIESSVYDLYIPVH